MNLASYINLCKPKIVLLLTVTVIKIKDKPHSKVMIMRLVVK